LKSSGKILGIVLFSILVLGLQNIQQADATAQTGDIGAVIDFLEFNTTDTTDTNIIQVSGDTFAVAYVDASGNGQIATFTVDNAGDINNAPVVDGPDQIAAGGIAEPQLFHITGDIYGIVYEDGGSITINTFDINNAGTISPIATTGGIASTPITGTSPDIVKLSGAAGTPQFYAIGYTTGAAVNIVTISITANGITVATVTATAQLDAAGDNLELVKLVDTGQYAAVYHTGTKGQVEIFTAADNGGGVNLAGNTMLLFAGNNISATSTFDIRHIIGTTYAVAYVGPSNQGIVETISITNTSVDVATLDNSDGGSTFASNVVNPVFLQSFDSLADLPLIIAYEDGSDNSGDLASLTINAGSGVVSNQVDTANFDTTLGREPFIAHRTGDFYVVSYEGTANDGFVTSFNLGTAPDLISPTPVITSTASPATNVTPIPVVIDFGETVNGFVVGDIALSGTAGATLGALTDNTNGNFSIPVNLTSNGTVILNIAANAATDTSTNNSLAATQFTITFDTVPPVFSGVTPAAASTVSNTGVIGYTLNELIASGTIVFTVDLGSPVADPNSPYTFNLSGTQLNAAFTTVSITTLLADATFTTSGLLKDGALYDVTINGADAAGNNAVAVGVANLTYTNTGPVLSNPGPADNSFASNITTVNYTTNKLLGSGTIVFTRDTGTADANSPHTYNLVGGNLAATSHSISIATLNSDSTFSTGGPLVNGARYDITITATDLGGNSATPITIQNITYDILGPVITITGPANDSTVTNANTINYSLSEAGVSGFIIFTLDSSSAVVDGNSPHPFSLLSSQLTAGAHSISIGTLNSDSAFSSGGELVNNAVYDVAITATDNAGNSATQATISNLTFNVLLPEFSSVTPADNAVLNNDDTINYTLNTPISFGTITFTTDSASTVTDANSPHTYNLSGTELDATSTSITLTTLLADSTFIIGGPLANGALYDVTISGTDALTNNATVTIQNILYDIAAPTKPVITSPTNNFSLPSLTTISGTSEADATIEVFDGTTSLGTTTADSAGDWTLTVSGLAGGTHTFTATATDTAGNTSLASNAITGSISTQFGSISGTVFSDTNGDGIQQSGELGLATAVFAIPLVDISTILETSSNSSGVYTFSDISTGDYLVQITIPNDHLPSAGFDFFSRPTVVVDQTTTLNFPVEPVTAANQATVNGIVFSDNNGDGIQQSGELGLVGVDIIVLDLLTLEFKTATTDGNGQYSITGLVPTVTLVQTGALPASFLVSQGFNFFSYVTLAPLGTATVNFPLEPVTAAIAGTITGSVFNDIDSDGIQDGGELGISGYTMTSIDLLTLEIRNATTDANGIYTFDNVTPIPGVTLVQTGFFPSGNILTSSSFFTYLSPDRNGTSTFNVAFHETTTSELVTINFTVYNDDNMNGIRDTGEADFEGITLSVFVYATSESLTAVSDSSGAGSITLIPSDFVAQVLPPAGFIATSPIDELQIPGAIAEIAPAPGSVFTMEIGLHSAG